MILGEFGVRGEVRVHVETDYPEQLGGKGEVQLRSPEGDAVWRPITRVRLAPDKRDIAVIKLEGVETREEAEGLRGWEMYVDRSQLVALPKDNFYIHDLVGLEVFTTDGRSLGPITEVLRQPANDVFVTEKALIPALKTVVVEVDIPGKRVVVEPIPGMIEE